MSWDKFLYLLPLITAVLFSFPSGVFALRRRYVPGSMALSTVMFATGIWSFFYIFELLAQDLHTIKILTNFEYIGITLLPLSWFIYTLIYSGRGQWLTRVKLALLCIIPALTLLMIWTNDLHSQMRIVHGLDTSGMFSQVKMTYGPWFWIYWAYSYALLLGGSIFIIPTVWRTPSLFRGQRIILFIALLMPWLGNLAYILKLSPQGLDLTPFGFSITGLAILVGMFRYQMSSVVPVARALMIDHMRDAVFVLDSRNLFLDINPAAEKMIGMSVSEAVGRDAARVFPDWWHNELNSPHTSEVNLIVHITRGPVQGYFDVSITPIHHRLRSYLLGRLIVIRDVTALKTAEEALKRLNEGLEKRVEERTAEINSINETLLKELDNRRQVELALRASEERYALAMRGANDGIWDWDLLTNTIYYSARWKAILGFTESEISNSPEEWWQRIHPDDVERVKTNSHKHLLGLTPDFVDEYRMRHKDGEYIWVLSRGILVENENHQPVRMAGSLTNISTRKWAEEQVQFNALHDNLTGLPNRALLLDRLERAIERLKRRPDMCAAVLYLDFDHFKVVNDSLGHLVGDQLLVEIARRLQNCIRSEDTAARLGGDEFVILLEEAQNEKNVISIANRILAELSRPFRLGDQQVFSSASIGIIPNICSYENAMEILRDADLAMYNAKKEGRGCYRVFDESLHVSALSHMQLGMDLREAIERDELRVFYQPLMDLQNRRVVGFEALLRWEHPVNGLISPDWFIAVAEETNLIISIGLWVLRKACEQMKAWMIRYPQMQDARMHVNLSAKQFSQPDLVTKIQNILEDVPLNTRNLGVEITETVLMSNQEVVINTFTQLRQMGVHTSMDDFGTGYSSLSYLQRFPVNTIKIDRSFVSKLEIPAHQTETQIIKVIVNLAEELGMNTVAEGVETEAQLTDLLSLGCRYGQGFLFSRPQSAAQIEQSILEARMV